MIQKGVYGVGDSVRFHKMQHFIALVISIQFINYAEGALKSIKRNEEK